jgi:predicted nicotinamide N-methyase
LGHGAVVWDASIILAKYMENNPKLFNSNSISGKRVIELGSGCGLGGLAFMMRGAMVTLTDLDPVVQALTSLNARNIYSKMLTEFSSVQIHAPKVIPLDWTDFSVNSFDEEPYDLVLLTDCVFSSDLVPYLVSAIRAFCGPKSEILCCHEIRDEVTNSECFTRSFLKFYVYYIKAS